MMANHPETNMLLEYYDNYKEETITLKEVASDDQSRFQVKWTCKVGNDYEADYTEFRTYNEARDMFFKFMHTYVLNNNRRRNV